LKHFVERELGHEDVEARKSFYGRWHDRLDELAAMDRYWSDLNESVYTFFHDAWTSCLLDPPVPHLVNADGEDVLISRIRFDVTDPAALEAALDSASDLEREQEKRTWRWLGANSKEQPDGARIDRHGRGGSEKGGSGVVVLPCGAGKTVVGLAAMERVGQTTLPHNQPDLRQTVAAGNPRQDHAPI
jgi:hypothetical protein